MEMELTIEVMPEGEGPAAIDSGLSSPMGGKHQRSLSLSEKWATNKALALEYLKRQREIMVWIEGVLKRKLPTSDMHETLKSGIVLRELMEVLFPQAAASAISPISRKYSQRMAPWKERENISVFLKQCKALGMNDLSLFCTDDLYEGTNMVQVLFCVQHFMSFSAEHSGLNFQPVVRHSAAMSFSNQEVEMALSKLEQAGMNASALKDLIVSSGVAPDSPSDEEIRNVEIVDGFEAAVGPSAEVPSSLTEEEVAGEDEDGDEQIFDQIEQLEQDLESDECNQPAEAVESVDSGSLKGTKHDSPESKDVDDDADPALNDPGDVVDAIDVESVVIDSIQEGTATEDANAEVEKEVVALSVNELQELSQILSDMITDIETEASEEIVKALQQQQAEESKPEVPVAESEEVVMAPDRLCESELNTELIDGGKSETVEADSTMHAVVEEVTEVEEKTKVSKKKKKRTKTKRARSSSDEQLEAEVMAKCACGRGCTTM